MAASIPPDGRNRIVFGMVPQRDDERTRILLSDLCAYLAKEVGVSIVPHRSPSAEALASALGSGRVHVAWTGALLVFLSEHLSDVVALLSSVREGVAFYHSIVFTPLTSPIRDLAGAKGKRIAWVAASSAAGYVVPRLSLVRRGLSPSELFAEEMFSGSHTAAVRAALLGEVDLAATYAIFEDGDPSKELVKSGVTVFDPERKVRVLDVSGPIPGDLIVAVPTLSAEVRRGISSALLRIASDAASKEIMSELIGADGFTPVTPMALREMRALIEVARASGALRPRD